MASIGDIWLRVLADANGFEADLVKQTGPAADRAGATLGQKLGAGMKMAIGAAAGALVGVATSQGAELDATMRQLQADTGMTDAAAQAAAKSIASMYAGNLQGITDIGKSMAVVVNGLDLTGAAADAMTQKFLTFETATGQDSTAVSAFHEILNAWSLDASAVPGIMDLLVASHQKYGSSITDNEAALQKLAPQMRAMGMTVTDTVNLLNLFDAAGMDASKAMFALNTAVQKLKPGQTLNDLIKQIASIEDPTKRAQEAVKIFGARGGVNLANALKPGITSLNDFATSAADTAGATDTAAKKVESSWQNVAKEIAHQIAGPLAEIGQQFGPLLMVSTLAGPKVLAALGGIGGALGGALAPAIRDALGLYSPTTKAAIAASEAVGVAMGTATATTATATEGTALAAGQAAVATEVEPAAVAAGTSIGGALALAIATAGGAALAVWANGWLQDWWNGLGKSIGIPMPAAGSGLPGAPAGPAVGSPDWLKTHPNSVVPESTAATPMPTGTNTPGAQWVQTAWVGPIRLSADEIDKAIKAAMRGAPKAIADAGLDMRGAMDTNMSALTRILQSQYTSQLTRAGITVGSSFANGIALSGKTVRAAAEALLKTAADGIRSSRSEIDSAIDQVNADLKAKAITQTAEVTNLVTSLLAPALSTALKSPDKQVQADAKYLEQLLTDRLSEINLRPGIISDKTKALIDAAKKSADPQIREMAKTFEDLYAQDLGKTGQSPKVQDAGTNVGTDTAKSMVQGAIDWLGSSTARQQLGDAWAAAVASVSSALTVVAPAGGAGNPNWRDSGGPVFAGTAYRIGVPEVFVPAVDGRILNESQIARLPTAGDRTQNFNIDHITVADANDEMSVIQRLRFMALAQG
jgi:hypothetical protein